MPARVEVFCSKPVALAATELESVLAGADLMTMAETLDPPPEDEEALVEAMWEHFRIDSDEPPMEIHWSEKYRPIQLGVADAELTRAVVEEMLAEYFADDDSESAKRVCEYLRRTKQLVTFELSFDGADQLGGVLVEELAYAIAERGDGIVWFWGNAFALPADRPRAIWECE